jgi:ABC-type Na+ efflux pump permease subunit
MTWAAFSALLDRELRALARERTVLIAFTIQLFIASFSSGLLMGLMAIYDPSAERLSQQIRPRVAVVGVDHVATGDRLVEILEGHHARVTTLATPAQAQAAFEAGELEAALLVPERANAVLNAGEFLALELVLPDSETQETVMRMVLRKPLAEYENVLRQQNDIELRYRDVAGEPSTAFEFRYGALVPLLMFFPAFVTGGIVVDTVSEEMVNRTLETLWSTPLSLNAILGAKMSAALLVSLGQSLLWMALLTLNGIRIRNFGVVLLLSALGAVMIAVVAALLSLSFGDRERSQFVYALFILIVTGVSYFSDYSPVALISRFAIDDPSVSLVHVAAYVVLAGGLVAALSRASRKLVAPA